MISNAACRGAGIPARAERDEGRTIPQMWLTLTILVATTVLVILLGRRQRWTIEASQLGSVSERWLAEYRASHPS